MGTEDKEGITLDKQDTDEVFLRLTQLEEELLEIKNMLTMLNSHYDRDHQKAA